MKIQIVSLFFLLAIASISPVYAQGHRYMTLGRNPCHTGGYSDQEARGFGWEVYRFEQDEFLEMQGASGEHVSGWLPKGTRAAIESGGRVRLLDCGNPTNLRIRLQTRVQIVERERIVQAPPEQVPMYIFAPTVYPTSPVPQPQITYVARPPVIVDFSGLAAGLSGNNAPINLFNGSAANGGSNMNGNWNDNGLLNVNNIRNTAGATGGSTGPITNQNGATSGSTSSNYNANGTSVGTGTGNVGTQTGR